MRSPDLDADCCIVGGGPVGLFLAALVGSSGARCLVLEARPPDAAAADRRTLALSWSSHLKLLRVGVDLREGHRATPITSIHVSGAGHAGRTVLDAAEARVGALGFVVRYGDLVQALLPVADAVSSIRTRCPVEGITDRDNDVEIHTARGTFRAGAVVVADGAADLVRSLGVRTEHRDYGVHALVGRVTVAAPRSGVAFERFDRHGPLALLPEGDRYALVWTLAEDDAVSLRQCADDEFLGRLQSAFGWRLGRITAIAERATFPLALRRSDPVSLGRVVMIGNAAQTLHPVAGQGLNLGLRDAWQLHDCLARPDVVAALASYAASRRTDRSLTIGFTDMLARVFGVDVPGANIVRGLSIEALDLLPSARRLLARVLATTPQR